MKKLIITAAALLPFTTIHADENAAGKAAYATCTACHGPDGKGIKAGPNQLAPTLEKSEIVTGDPDTFVKVILKGIVKEKDSKFLMAMAPLEAAYTDDQKLADVVNYVRTSFGNKASKITARRI